MKHFSRWFITSALASSINVFSPGIALAEETTALPETDSQEVIEETPREETLIAETPIVESLSFVSTGERFEIKDLGISMTAPVGWEVMTKTSTLSAVIQEPKDEKPSYDKPKYQRNITVAAAHRATPIDEVRAEELKKEMIENFSKDPMISEFQILEHRFFNNRGVNDGLLIYSSYKLADYEMMQMHTLISGNENQFLITYTDLTSRFSDEQTGTFQQAWQSMTSLEVSGQTPLRRDEYIKYGTIAGIAFLFIGFLGYRSRKASKFDYFSEDLESTDLTSTQSENHSIMSTLQGGWKISGNKNEEFNSTEVYSENYTDESDDFDDDDGFTTVAEFSEDFDTEDLGNTPANKTKITEYVSNY